MKYAIFSISRSKIKIRILTTSSHENGHIDGASFCIALQWQVQTVGWSCQQDVAVNY